MQNHPCTHLWVGWIKEKIPSNLTGESLKKYGPFWYTIEFDRACRSSGTRARCMDWHKKYHASMSANCTLNMWRYIQDSPERWQAWKTWRTSTNLCV